MDRAYKIVILDDESLITQGLAQTIEWDKLGCYVACTGNDGEEGLRLIQQHQPDILITDIIMPGKSGLELSEYVQQNMPHTRVILLTAYEDFEFARTAIRYGVSQYIVKPMDKKQIIQAVNSVVSELQQDHIQKRTHEHNSLIAKHARPIISQSMLFDSALFGISDSGSQQMPTDFFDPAYQCGVIALIKHPHLEDVADGLVGFSIHTQLESFMQKQGVKCIYKQLDKMTLVIFALDDTMGSQAFQHHIQTLLQELLEDIALTKTLACHAAVSGLYKHPEDMHQAYQYTQEQLKQCYFHYQPSVVVPSKTSTAFSVPPLEELMEMVALGNIDKAIVWWNKTVQTVASQQQPLPTIEWLRQTLSALQALVYRHDDLDLPKIQADSLTLNGNFYDHQALLWRIIEHCCLYFLSKQSLSGRMQMITEKNYHKSDFSLQFIAQELDLNQSYLSRMFRKQTGVAFSQYLGQLRIDRAKHLLRFTRLKNYEIAQQIGFTDEHYFSKVFKQRCGISPTQYRSMQKSDLTQ